MKYFLPLICLILLASCKKTLDENPQSIAAENFYNTADEVAAGVNAIYVPLRAEACIGALYLVQLECYADYLYGRGSHAPLNEYQGLDNTNIGRIGGMWTNFYQAIRNANIVISRAPKGNKISKEDVAKFVGEAKFLRALAYFDLVRNWAGVPLRTENNMDSINVKRSSVAEVYALILDDLSYAENNLPDAPRLAGAPSKWAAKTVLADVYLNLQRYADASAKALEVIQSNKFSLVNVSSPSDFEKLYGADVATSTEEIFYFKYSRLTGQGFGYLIYAHYPGSGYYPPGGYYTAYSDTAANSFIKNWDRNDLRYSYNWYRQTFGLGNATILNRKFRDPLTTTGAGNDYPMYRYADLLLLYAEAAARAANGPITDAMEKLNMVHRRAYGRNPSTPDKTIDFSLGDYASLQAFLDLLVKERGYETCFEGKRWLDLKRMGIAKDVIKAVKGKTVADKHMLWPIPTGEYNYNKAIDPVKDQNPGY